jgi:hypothetical protein
LLILVAFLAAAVHAAAQRPEAEAAQDLRAELERRYDIVPLTNGVALRPKSPTGDVRLIEISDTIAINGVPVTGRELRERVGADADAILRLSYLDDGARRALLGAPKTDDQRPRRDDRRQPEAEPGAPPSRSPGPDAPIRHRSSGDRVRIFGNVAVAEGEEVAGQVVAVIGSVRVDGEVGQQVVAVLGSVELGPHAIVHGDVVSVGGHLHKAEGAEIQGAVTEVSLGDVGARVNVSPWMDGWGPVQLGFGPVAHLVGSTFRVVLLAMLACLAMLLARRPVEGSAQRVADNPVKATLVGLAAWVFFAPVFILTAIVLAISIIGIPLLLLLPFAALLLLLMALVGFSGTAYAVGQWVRRRLAIGYVPPFVDVCLGVFVLLMPLLVGRVVALAGWPLSPLVFLLLAIGVAVELLAWSSGFGAVLTNTFARLRATRAARRVPQAPPAVP